MNRGLTAIVATAGLAFTGCNTEGAAHREQAPRRHPAAISSVKVEQFDPAAMRRLESAKKELSDTMPGGFIHSLVAVHLCAIVDDSYGANRQAAIIPNPDVLMVAEHRKKGKALLLTAGYDVDAHRMVGGEIQEVDLRPDLGMLSTSPTEVDRIPDPGGYPNMRAFLTRVPARFDKERRAIVEVSNSFQSGTVETVVPGPVEKVTSQAVIDAGCEPASGSPMDTGIFY